MSEIRFSADLDSSKLESAIKQSNKTISDWAKDVEKSGTQADRGLGKMTKSFKQAIAEQKQLIKSIEKDVKELQKVYDDVAFGRAKQAAGGELRAAKKALAEEQATLIGLQNQQIEANNEEESTINKLTGSIGKWVAGLFTLGASLKITKAIIESTTDTSLAYHKIIEGATAGVQYFFKAISSGDFTNFWQGLDRSIKGAQEFLETMESINNKQNEQKIRSSQYDIEIAELRDKTYDKEDANNKERIDALTQIVDLQKKKYTEEAALAKEAYEANIKKAATASGLEEIQIETFLKEFSSLEDMIEKGKEYNELKRKMYAPGVTIQRQIEIQDEIDALGKAGESAAKYAKQISRITPAMREELSNFLSQANAAEAAFGQKNRRDKMQLTEVTNKIKKQEIEAAKIETKITKANEDLTAAVIAGDEAQIKSSSAKIVALQAELDIRNKLVDSAIATASLNIEGIASVTGLTNIPTLGRKIATPGLIAPDSKYAAINKERLKKLIDQEQERLDIAEKRKKVELEILQAATQLTYQLGQQLGLDEKTLILLGSELDAFIQLASGNYIGAAISMFSSIIAMIPNEAEKFAKQIQDINKLIEEQQRLIELSERKGGREEALQGELDLLQQQKEVTQAALEKAEYKLRHSQGGIFYGKRLKAVDDLTVSLAEVQKQVEDAQTALDDFLSGGVVQNNIADIIAQGFQEGKTSIDDFANYMNQVLSDAVMNIFKAEILGSAITEATDFITYALKDRKLTPEEKHQIDVLTKRIADENKELWDDLTGALNLGSEDIANTGLTGQIQRSITEETGSELAGLFRRFADEQRVVKDYSMMGVAHLIGIETNTLNTVLELQKAVVELQAININTKQVPTGAL